MYSDIYRLKRTYLQLRFLQDLATESISVKFQGMKEEKSCLLSSCKNLSCR